MYYSCPTKSGIKRQGETGTVVENQLCRDKSLSTNVCVWSAHYASITFMDENVFLKSWQLAFDHN